MARTYRQMRFGLNQSKYWVTKDRYESKLWIVYLPTIPFYPGERIVNRFETHVEAIDFVIKREDRLRNAVD
jgi:hypothetical protein